MARRSGTRVWQRLGPGSAISMVRMMQKNGYVRSLQITGGVIALLGFLGLAVQVWTMVRTDWPSNHSNDRDRSDRTRWNNDASVDGAAPASDPN